MIPGTQVGMDSCYRPIHVGDTIIDIDGRRYTIDEQGRAVTEGGKTLHLTEVLEIVVVREWKPKAVTVQTFTPNAKPKVYKFDFSDVPPDQRHRAVRLAADKAYKERNKEQVAAYMKAYYQANIDAIREKQRAYYQANRERLIAKAKANHEKKQANKSK